MARPPLACAFAALLGLALGAAPSAALELSDVKLDFTSTGLDPDAAGSLRLRAQGGEATLQIKLRDVDADPVHLCSGPDEASLLHRTELDPSGGTLSSDGELDFDPRGKVLAVANAEACSEASLLLTAEVGEPGQCTSGEKGVKIHERTALEPGSAMDSASAELLYHLLPDRNCKFAGSQQGEPRRKARLSVRVKHADPGDRYEVCIDDVDRGDLSTNAAGVGRADFTFNRPKGSGQGNSKRAVIDFDAYASSVEIRNENDDCTLDDETAVFFGALLAPLCAEEAVASVTLAPPVADPAVTGEASLERSESCSRVFVVHVEGLDPNAAYDVHVGGTLEGDDVLSTDGSGAAEVEFSTDAGPGEPLLDFDPSGQLVEVRDATGTTLVLSGTLP